VKERLIDTPIGNVRFYDSSCIARSSLGIGDLVLCGWHPRIDSTAAHEAIALLVEVQLVSLSSADADDEPICERQRWKK
jgi:hypothetical protein